MFFETADDFARWLGRHHRGATELLVGFHKVSSAHPSLTWRESVDVALCHGWIDGVRRSLGPSSYTVRFTPRKKGSHWSPRNVERVEALRRAGLMRPAGLAAFESRSETATLYYERRRTARLPAAFEATFRESAAAWEHFTGTAASYQKTAAWWVIQAKREETRGRRLRLLIEASLRREKLGVIAPGPRTRRASPG